MRENDKNSIRKILINYLCGMKRKAHGAREPGHIQKSVEVTSTAQRGDSPAQAINQRFLRVNPCSFAVLNKRRKLKHCVSVISLFYLMNFSNCMVKAIVMDQDFEKLRNKMVEEQLKTRNIKSQAVLNAMRTVPRHLFVPENLQSHAYDDSPLQIGLNQTISQPYIVAYMTEQLDPVPGMKVLEIGTGSGYQTAILAQIGCKVYSIELLEELAARAEKTLARLNFENVKTKSGNGYLGWPEEAPFDVIIVTAAPGKIPEKLIGQLKDGGKMIVPVGPVNSVQSLKLITKKGNEITEKDLLPVLFVPMVE